MKRFNAILTIGLLGGLATALGQLEIKPGTTVDLGEFPAEKAPMVAFELMNTGTEPLHIVAASSKCSCLNPVLYEKEIRPGESTPLDVFINGNLLSGAFNKQVQLRIGTPTTTHLEITIKGTALKALDGIPKFIFSGQIPLGQPWQTNLLLNIRADLTEKPALHVEGLSPLQAKLTSSPPLSGQTKLTLRMPPQTTPLLWENKIALSFPDHPSIPKQIIAINGCCGGILTPSTQKLKASAQGANFILQRTDPNGVSPHPSPLSCSTPGILIQETPLPELGKSTIHLSFSEAFLQHAKKEGRIAIQLLAEGFIPANLVVEAH